MGGGGGQASENDNDQKIKKIHHSNAFFKMNIIFTLYISTVKSRICFNQIITSQVLSTIVTWDYHV